MKIYLKYSTNIGSSKSFLASQILTEAAKQQEHQVIEEESEADLIIILGDLSVVDERLFGKKVFFTDLEKAFHAPEDTLKKAVLESQIYTSNSNNCKRKKIVAVTACPTGVIQTFMSAEAIAEYAKAQGWDIKVETRGQVGANNLISKEDVINADLVFVAADIEVDLSKFHGKLMYRTSTELALKKTAQEFDRAFESAVLYADGRIESDVNDDNDIVNNGFSMEHKRVVAVTACPTGVIQTFMSAEAIAEYAKKQGWEIKVETRGQTGANNLISKEDVVNADLVFIATDIDVDLSKFKGKLMYRTSTELALKKTKQEFDKAFKEAVIYEG